MNSNRSLHPLISTQAAKRAKRRASAVVRRGSGFMMENPMSRQPRPPADDDDGGAIELGDIYAGGGDTFAAENPMSNHRHQAPKP